MTWLTAQLDEDERAAKDAADTDSGEWFVGDKWNVYRAEDLSPWEDRETNALVVYGNVKAQSDHIAQWDPVRVLAEIEAKRAILQFHVSAATNPHHYCHMAAVATLRLLALPYRDRLGFQPEWAAEAARVGDAIARYHDRTR